VWNSRRARDRLAFLLLMPDEGQRGVKRRHDVDGASPPFPLFDGPGLGEAHDRSKRSQHHRCPPLTTDPSWWLVDAAMYQAKERAC